MTLIARKSNQPALTAHRSNLDIGNLQRYSSEANQGLSVESQQFVAGIKDGNFDVNELSGLAGSFESAMFEPAAAAALQNNAGHRTGIQIAAMLRASASNLRGYLDMFTGPGASMESAENYATSTASEYPSVYATESFDNQSLVDNLAISIGLNYNVARQGAAMEMIYRLIALTPEQGAVDIEFTNLFLQNTVQHSATGAPSDYHSKRVIDASIDASIVADNATTLIPQVTADNLAMFVAPAVVAPWTYRDASGRRQVTTSALIINKEINLLGLSNLDTVARNGQADNTDALDRNLGVGDLFISLGGDTVTYNLRGIPYTRWVKGVEQGSRELKLNVTLTSLFLDGNTVDVEGNELTGGVWDTLKTGGYRVRLKLDINGNADVEKGTAKVTPSSVEVMSIVSIVNGVVTDVPKDTGVGAQIVSDLEGLKVEGWWPSGRVINSNHRYLGQLVNTRGVRERLVTRTRAPVYVPFPITEDRDQTVLDQLTYTVSKSINADGISKLFEYHDRLTEISGGALRGELTPGDYEVNAIPMEGVGRYLINPYVDTVEVDLSTLTQSRQTLDNIRNAQEALANTVRATAFNILQKTNYENAAAYIDGGEIQRQFKFALVTSKYIENFLTKAGDSRTFGAGLPFEIKSDVDSRLEEVMFLTLVREGDGIDPLSGGILLYTASLVATIQTHRFGAPRKEAIMQPRYEHYNLLPIIVRFNVKGVAAALQELLRFQVESVIVDEADSGNGGTGGQPGPTPPVTPTPGGNPGSGGNP